MQYNCRGIPPLAGLRAPTGHVINFSINESPRRKQRGILSREIKLYGEQICHHYYLQFDRAGI